MSKQRNLSEALRALREELMAELRVAMPARIEAYDHNTQRASVAPGLRRKYRDGSEQALPVVDGVPIVWPRSGGASVTLPVKRGDGCLLIFADRSLDNWLSGAEGIVPGDGRKHALPDAIAVMGLNPFTTTAQAPNNTDLLIQYAGAIIRIAEDGAVDVEASDVARIKAPSIVLDGEVTVTGGVTADGDVVGDGISLSSHVHGGVQGGSSTTGAPQ